MKTKPFVAWLILGLFALAVWFTWPLGRSAKTDKSSESATSTPFSSSAANPPPAPAGGTPPPVPAATPRSTGIASNNGPSPAPGATPGLPNTTEPGGPNQAAQVDAGRVRRMIGDYHNLLGENPVGTNAEIMHLMTGGNSRQAVLGPPDGISLNAQGELVDQWGSPYFFHQLSRDKMEVRSAGPDKVMWTVDDVIAR